MTATSRLRFPHRAPAVPRKLRATDLAPGDNLQVDRGFDRVISVAHHDGSRTIDCKFESGRQRTFQYTADLAVGSH
jgi:hypothetical protein